MKVIVTADWHLRKDRPRCRLDENWVGTQARMVEFVFARAAKEECDVWVIGDIYHTPVVPPEIELIIPSILSRTKYKDVMCFVLPGNHDVQYGNPQNLLRSSLGVLLNTHSSRAYVQQEDDSIQCAHTLVWPDESTKPEPAPGLLPDEIFEMYPKARCIFTGDYHHAFAVRKGDQLLVNPGCITRQTADMKDYRPVFYIVDTNTLKADPVSLPDTEPVVTDLYLEREKERDGRIESFIELVAAKGGVSLDFRENLRAKLPKVPPEVRDEVEDILAEVSA